MSHSPSRDLPAIAILLVGAAIASHGQAPAKLPRTEHKIVVIAHRGGAAVAPENTLAAFRQAIALGADYVEVDVRATHDGQLVLMHDRTVDRTTNGSGAVADLDLAAVRKLDAGSKRGAQFAGERVPTFDEALSLCRGKINVYLDHKSGAIAEVAAAVRRNGMSDQVVVYTGGDEARQWKQAAPELPVMVSPGAEHRQTGKLKSLLQTCPVEVLDGSAGWWTAELVQEAHALGAQVFVDNLGLEDIEVRYRRAVEMGVDGIQTDHPDVLLQLLGRLGVR